MAPSEPLLAAPVVNVSSQVSKSVPVRATTMGVSSFVEVATLLAVGGSFTQLRVTVTAAGAEVSVPSFVVYVNEPCEGAQTWVAGVKVTDAESVLGEPGVQALFVTAPSEPLVATPVAKVRSQVSGSAPVSVTTTGVSSFVDVTTLLAVGRSFTQFIVMVTEAGGDVSVPSS